jgi:hypothetical protein
VTPTGDVLAEHHADPESFEAAGGQEIDTQGDSFFVAFPRAKDAVTAAVAAQIRGVVPLARQPRKGIRDPAKTLTASSRASR